MIAFTGRDERNRFDIFTVEPGSGYISGHAGPGRQQVPDVVADDRYVAFVHPRRLERVDYVMTADGYFQHNITPNGAGFETPRGRLRCAAHAPGF